jgi:hypothetical protein
MVMQAFELSDGISRSEQQSLDFFLELYVLVELLDIF